MLHSFEPHPLGYAPMRERNGLGFASPAEATRTSTACGPAGVDVNADATSIRCHRFLGGLLRHYYRDAA